LASLGLAKLIKDTGFQLEFKRHITLVDTEDVEDSGEEQELAVTEWTQGANPVSCKWVK
jgi:hypothetical protein